MNKINGITLTGEIASWKYFSFPLTFHLLVYLYLSTQEQDGDSVTVSVRQLCRQFNGVTYKELRVAFQHLVDEGIISACRKGRMTVVSFRQWHGLSGIMLPCGAQLEAQSGAQLRAQSELQPQPLNKGVSALSSKKKGAIKGAVTGANEGADENRAQLMTQLMAQSENLQPSENKPLETDTNTTKGAIEGAIEGANNRKGSLQKEKVSPTPPLNKKNSLPPKDQKNKKRLDDAFFEKVRTAFNSLAIGTAIRSCTKMSEERKQLVRNFIDDYSVEDLDRLFAAVREAPRLYQGRSGKSIQFDTLFSPKFYVGIMEGSWSAPEPQPKKVSSLPEPPAQTVAPAASSSPQPTYKEQKKMERRKLLQGYIDAVVQNPKHVCLAMLMASYRNGELKELGLDWKPSIDSEVSQLEELNRQGQQIHAGAKKQSVSAQEMLAEDPDGLLARILSNNK
jgi:hypothetical protein